MHAGGIATSAAGGEGVLVSTDFADDAAVVRLGSDPDRALVLTADVIAPLVDDPETFGRIAATNAISDVYAMGGRPLYALNLVFFPDDQLPFSLLEAILRGGAAACAEAGVAIVGGHTVRDAELKYGLSVTGEVDRAAILSNRTARAGQRLVLSKALGTGVIGQAIKKRLASAGEIAAASASMTTHNRGALEAGRRAGVTSCTDVTGFGLLGHLRNILRGSGLTAAIDLASLPLLPGAAEHAAAGVMPCPTCARKVCPRPTSASYSRRAGRRRSERSTSTSPRASRPDPSWARSRAVVEWARAPIRPTAVEEPVESAG
jgi:selenide,water dikinase